MTTRPTDRSRPVAEFERDFDAEFAQPAGAARARDDASLPAASPRRGPAVHSHDSLSAVFGQCERTGQWSVPDRLSVEAWFGEVKLDFRDAEIASDGVVEVQVNAVFGSVTLKVPRGTEIEMSGASAFFGEVGSKRASKKLGEMARGWLLGQDEDDYGDEYEYDDGPDPVAEEPMLLRLRGSAIFGSVSVEID